MDDVNPFAAPRTLKPLANDKFGRAAALRERYFYREASLRALGAVKLMFAGAAGLLSLAVIGNGGAILFTYAAAHALIGFGLWRLFGWACSLQLISSGFMAALSLWILGHGLQSPSLMAWGLLLLAVHGGTLYVVVSWPTPIVCGRPYRVAAAKSNWSVTGHPLLLKIFLFSFGWFAAAVALMVGFESLLSIPDGM